MFLCKKTSDLFGINQKINITFVMSSKTKDMELTEKERELIEAIRLYKKLRVRNMTFSDFILYLRGYFEELLEEEGQ